MNLLTCFYPHIMQTLITLDISHGYVHEEDVQYLVPVLENNHVKFKLFFFMIL